jgi:hypothetical protein
MGLFLPGEEDVLEAMLAETLKLAVARGIERDQMVRVAIGISASVVDTLTKDLTDVEFEGDLDMWCEAFRSAARAIRVLPEEE